MSKIFISHSSANNTAALAVANWLADSGWEYFLDITASSGLAPGERWQEALKSAADRCEAVLFLISPAWQASRWCLAEFLLAKQIGKTIFGVLVEPTPLEALPREMTSEWQLCDLVTGTARQSFRVSQDPIVTETEVSFAEDGLLRLRIGLQRAGLDPASFPWPPPSDPNRAPYRGLKALEPEDAAVFFGREAAIVRGLDALRGSRERGVEGLFVILGASGAGKSSFLRAGLWPRLIRDDRHFLPLPIIRPERAVISGVTGLAASLEAAFRERKATRSRAVINQALQEPGGFDRLIAELQTLAILGIEPDASPPIVVISIDQGEELFSVEGGAEAGRFLDLLAQTLSPPELEGAPTLAARQRALAIVAIRSDSYERLQTEQRLAQVAPYLFSLPPIVRAEFKAVVDGPATRHSESGHRLTVAPALTERLVNDTEGADALPLLAFTLERLFVEHGGDGRLLLEDYEALGGVRGSIEAAVEIAFAEPGREPVVPADKVTRQRQLRAGFIPWLARVDPDTEERKRRVARWEEIPADARPLLERLIEQRLLVRDRRRLENREDTVVVEVAHEALLRQWPTLTAWLDEDAAALKMLDAVQRAAGEWANNREEAGGEAWLVHIGDRLLAGEALRRRPDFERLLGADGQAYLDACRARDERLRREKEERVEAARIRQQRFSWVLGALLVMAVGTASYVWYQQRAAAQQGKVMLSRRLVDQTYNQFRINLPFTTLLAASAHYALPTSEARLVLQQALSAQPPPHTSLSPSQGKVWSVTFSPDGKTLAFAGDDNTVILWDVARREPLGEPLTGHEKAVSSVAFSPDGKTLASGSEDKTVILWDVASREPLGKPLTGHRDAVRSVAFSPDPDGKTLASASSDKTVILWDVARREPLGEPLTGHEKAVSSVAFSPDGKTLASGSEDKTVILWDVASREPLGKPLTGHRDAVRSVAFSPDPDGKTLASASSDKTVILWDVARREPLGEPLKAYLDLVRGVAFSPDGKILAANGVDRSVVLWDVASRKPLGELLRVHKDEVLSVAFSPDGKTLASASADQTVILWNLASPKHLGELLEGHQDQVLNVVAFSPDPDRKTIASASDDNTVILWDVVSHKPLGEPLVGHQREVADLTFSPDGKTLASASWDQTVILWDVVSRKQPGESLRGHLDAVRSVAFSPNGKTLASASWDQTVILWDVVSRKQLGEPLRGHLDAVRSVAFSPDGKTLASGSEDKTVILWDVASRKPLSQPLKGHLGAVRSVAFSPDDRTLVSNGVDGTVLLWEVANRKPRGEPLEGHQGAVSSVAFSPDGKTLATANSDKTVILWDVASRKPRGEPLERHQDAVLSVAFSHDGKTLASASSDKSVMLWDVASSKQVGELKGYLDTVRSVAFSPDDKTLASTGDQTVILWDVDVSSWADKACTVTHRNLTLEEWARYVGEDFPYEDFLSQAHCPEPMKWAQYGGDGGKYEPPAPSLRTDARQTVVSPSGAPPSRNVAVTTR